MVHVSPAIATVAAVLIHPGRQAEAEVQADVADRRTTLKSAAYSAAAAPTAAVGGGCELNELHAACRPAEWPRAEVG
jgi:hypothetical protein